MRKAILAVAYALMTSGAAYAQIGSCGDDVEWSISGNTLTITGTGPMTDFTTFGSLTTDKVPSWDPYKNQIEHVVIGQGITSIGGFTFYDYNWLKSVSLPEGLESIGPLALYNCDGLSEIRLPESLTTLSNYQFGGGGPYGYHSYTCATFYGCDGLTEITIPENMTFIGGRAFYSCNSLERVTWNAANCKLGLHGIGGYSSSYEAFMNCPIHEVHFGTSVKHIPAYLFKDNPLVKVITSGSIETVGTDALNKNSVWFNELSIHNEMVMIDHALYHFSTQKVTAFEIVLPDHTYSIASNVFENEKYLVKLTVPESFAYMGNDVFKGCSALSEVIWNARQCKFSSPCTFSSALYRITFGENVEVLGANMLNGCSGIKQMVLPENLRKIEDNAISGCNGLTSLSIPDNVTYLGKISGPAKLTVGVSVDTISGIYGNELTEVVWKAKNPTAIYSLPRTVTNLTFSDDVEVVPSKLCDGCTALTTVNFGNSIKQIKTEAFRGCTSLSDIYLPEGLETVEYSAFSGVNRTPVVYLPESVSTVDYTLLHYGGIVIHANSRYSFNTSYNLSAFSATFYVADINKYYAADWRWKDYDKLYPMAEIASADEITFPYTGEAPSFDNLPITCNIPGYSVTISNDKFRPGTYDTVRAHFSSEKHSFDAEIPMAFTITANDEVTEKRAELEELSAKAHDLLNTVAGFKPTDVWYDVELNDNTIDSNAKRMVSDIYGFTSWDVLTDNDPSTIFCSEYGNIETTDGLDHYLQIAFGEHRPTMAFRFNYTTWQQSRFISAPTKLTVYGTEDGTEWRELAVIADGLPVSTNTEYVSDVISSDFPCTAIRIMVNESTEPKKAVGHAYIVLSEFGVQATEVEATNPNPAIKEETVSGLDAALREALAVVNNPHAIPDEITEAYDALWEKYNALLRETASSGIDSLTDAEHSVDAYDLLGRRVKNPACPGRYIINGRKQIRH